MNALRRFIHAYGFLKNDAYRDFLILEELQKQNSNKVTPNDNNTTNNNKIQIGELSIGDNGTLSLEIHEIEINGKKIDIRKKLTKEELSELSNVLTKMNEIIIGKINKYL